MSFLLALPIKSTLIHSYSCLKPPNLTVNSTNRSNSHHIGCTIMKGG